MPYNNAYNQNIARQLNNLYKNKVKYENACCDNVRQNDVMDPLEGMALRRDDVHGGGGTAAATLQDLGYEQMKGTTGSGEPPEVKPKRKYVRKTPLPPDAPSVEVVGEGVDRPIGGAHIGGGVSAGGVSAGAKRPRKKKDPPPASDAASGSASGAGVSAGGVSAGGVSAGAKRGRKKKEEVSAAEVIAAAAPAPPATEGPGAVTNVTAKGGAKGRSERAAIVSKVMKEKGLKLAEASKYVKEHGLYKKGGALLTDKDAATMKPAGEKEPFHSGGVPNVTYSGKGKTVKRATKKI